MSWSIGYDKNQKRFVGYGVPAFCEHPECNKKIDRGLSYVCGGEPYGGNIGCGMYFCPEHLYINDDGIQLCEKCLENKKPFKLKPEHPEWINHILTDKTWKEWRKENKEEVKKLEKQLKK